MPELKRSFASGTSEKTGIACYGYRKDKRGALIINEQEAEGLQKTVHNTGTVYVSRCANRLENGNRHCQNSPTIREEELKQRIMEKLNLV